MAVTTGPALAAGLAGLVVLLAVLASTVGLGRPAMAVGLGCGVALGLLVRWGLERSPTGRLGPGDLVTLTRGALACGVAALVAESFVTGPAVATLVGLTAVALLLDAVDGPVARHSSTVSRFGAWFDGETDAFLMLVLSVYVARAAGPWVLAIGATRYLFAAAGLLWPWLRGRLPYRYWRKVVTAVQGVVLCVAAAGVLPPGARDAALAFALVLLAESFGRDVVWLGRHRPAAAGGTDPDRSTVARQR